MARHRTGRIVTALATGAILGATLAPVYAPAPALEAPCFLLCGAEGVADFLVNIVLYAPLGVGFALLGVRRRNAILVAFVLSTAVELLQAVLPGRDSSAGDIIANTLGAGLGFVLTVHAVRVLRPAPAGAAVRSLAWSGVVAAIIGATGVLMRPSFPAGEWYGQWTPEFGHLAWYGGDVLSARVGGLSVPSWINPRSDSLRALLSAGAPVRVRLTAGPPPESLAPIFAIADARRRTMLTLAADSTDLYFAYRMRSTDLRLNGPDLRIRDRLADLVPGDTVEIEAWRRPDGFCLAVDGRAMCELGFSPARGWSLFYWLRDAPPWVITGLDVFWIALLLFPLGLWISAGSGARAASRATPGPAGLLTRFGWSAAMGLALAALVFAPGLVGLRPSGFEEFIGLAAGLEAGLLARRAMRARLADRR